MTKKLPQGKRLEIRDKKVLVLGGAGMVGRAVCRSLLYQHPKMLVVHSLRQKECETEVEYLKRLQKREREKNLQRQQSQEPPQAPQDHEPPEEETDFEIEYGDIFVRAIYKDDARGELLKNPEKRKQLIRDILEDLDDEKKKEMTLWQILKKHEPEIVVDCINTATGYAYQNIYDEARQTITALDNGNPEDIKEKTEYLLCSLYIPQLVRHMQILNLAIKDAGTEFYLKIGTTGTGGMGINIPYTHGEQKPSKQLMSKTALAGAHTMLLYLMYASPELPITKEIKPSAAIAWKGIEYGMIRKKGKLIELHDCSPDNPLTCSPGEKLPQIVKSEKIFPITKRDSTEVQHLSAVYIDTGENGLFSRGEFTALTSQNQMEFVTPEEIAANVIYEIRGSNTGVDVLSAIRSATMGPSYRAGFMRSAAIREMKRLELDKSLVDESDVQLESIENIEESVAFESLGPHRLAKLLFEAYLLKLGYKTLGKILAADSAAIESELLEIVRTNPLLRSKIISIGIPILLPDGVSLLRAEEISIPEFYGHNELEITEENMSKWVEDGWIDLRRSNWDWWKEQFSALRDEVMQIPKEDQDSQTSFYVRTNTFWTDKTEINEMEIDIGEVVGWLFIRGKEGDEGGGRRGHQW